MIAEDRSPNNWDCVAPGGRFGIGRCPSWVLDIVLRSSSVMVIRAVNFLISLHRVVMRKEFFIADDSAASVDFLDVRGIRRRWGAS